MKTTQRSVYPSSLSSGISMVLILATAALLTSCGGSGDDGGTPNPVVPGDMVPPAVVSTSPASGSVDVPIDASLRITFSEPMNSATVNGTTVKVRAGGANVAGTITCIDDNVTFTPAANWGFATTYTVTVSGGPSGVKDIAGNPLAANYTWTFTTGQAPDTNPPRVISTFPANGATGVSVTTTVTATFSEVVANVTAATFRLSVGSAYVLGTITVNGSTATFTPSAPLAYGTAYTATLTTGVTDLAGNALASDYTWTFTTGQALDTTPPTVVSTFPANGATGVSVNTTVTATFNEAVTNVTTATFRLLAGSTAVSGTVAPNGATAVFTPTAPLAYGTTYVATLTTGVTDLSGNALASDYTWTFTTETGGWGNVTAVSSGTDNAGRPQLAMDASGAAVAVWEQGGRIWANRYVPAAGWSMATAISDGTGAATAARVATNDSGAAIAVWRQWDGTQYSVYANRYLPQSGWGAAIVIETGPGEAQGPQLAMDTSGNAITVWPQWDGAAWSIFANRFEPGTGWGAEALIEAASDNATNPVVAMDDAGHALVIWGYWSYPSSSHSGSLYWNVYEPGTGWATETRLDPGFGNATNAQVAMDGAGNAFAVWNQTNGDVTGSSIYVRRYEPGAGWGDGTRLEEVMGGMYLASPQVAISPTGTAAVVWAEGIANLYYDTSAIYARIYVPGTGWGARAMLSPSDWWDWYAWFADSPQVAMGRNGNALAVWRRRDGYTIYANRYVSGTGWETPTTVETADGEAFLPQVATDGSGNFIVVWQQWNGTHFNISAARYQEP